MKTVTMVNKIKRDVQSFTSDLWSVNSTTKTLAPLVLEAYEQFKKETKNGAKLEFCKLFASEAQLKAFPTTDRDAKAPGSTVQSLFNGIEYLLRRGTALKKMAELESKREQVLTLAAAKAAKEIKTRKLIGDEATALHQTIEHEALQAAGLERVRVSPDAIATIVAEGWTTACLDVNSFLGFTQQLLQFKYSETTASVIAAKAKAAIAEQSINTPLRRAA